MKNLGFQIKPKFFNALSFPALYAPPKSKKAGRLVSQID